MVLNPSFVFLKCLLFDLINKKIIFGQCWLTSLLFTKGHYCWLTSLLFTIFILIVVFPFPISFLILFPFLLFIAILPFLNRPSWGRPWPLSWLSRYWSRSWKLKEIKRLFCMCYSGRNCWYMCSYTNWLLFLLCLLCLNSCGFSLSTCDYLVGTIEYSVCFL